MQDDWLMMLPLRPGKEDWMTSDEAMIDGRRLLFDWASGVAAECIIREEITPQRDASIGIILVHKAILAEVNQKLAS